MLSCHFFLIIGIYDVYTTASLALRSQSSPSLVALPSQHLLLPHMATRMDLETYIENPEYADYFRDIPNKELNKVFAKILFGGCFAVGGVASFQCLPGLKIQGIGDISLPLSHAQADLIVAVGTQAPYGKGSETIVDKAVRNTIQVNPSLVTFSPRWTSMLDELARKACEGLGIHQGNFRAELYKLLLYQKGGHFKPHQDTEKSIGMFGTLVVQFPSSFTGGSSVVRHNRMQRTFRMGADDGSCSTEYHHVAHYADCEHEVEEITAGNRLVAVYSLVWADDCLLPPAPDMEASSRLVEILKREMLNRTLGYMLTHQYTRQTLSNFGLRALKRRDRTIAGALLAASAMMSADSPGDELVIQIARASQTFSGSEPKIDFEEVQPPLSPSPNHLLSHSPDPSLILLSGILSPQYLVVTWSGSLHPPPPHTHSPPTPRSNAGVWCRRNVLAARSEKI